LQVVSPELDELIPFIDWSPFFHAWELRGTYPAILDDPRYGDKARELYDDGRRLLDELVRGRKLRAKGVYRFFPAASDGDDIVVYTDQARAHERARLFMLRQQEDRSTCMCLADLVAAKGSGVVDFIGGFCVTAGIGVDELVARYESEHDDYHAIMVKALADRLAEAFAEWLHARVRKDWGHGDDLAVADLIAERYRGIRPAYGYPACPDHSEKTKLFELLDATACTSVTLTEGFAMVPTASVSGLYFGHPEAKYFAVGRIGKDQIEDYARRKGISVREAEAQLPSNLAY